MFRGFHFTLQECVGVQFIPFREAGTGDSGERSQLGGASSTILMPRIDRMTETTRIPETRSRVGTYNKDPTI